MADEESNKSDKEEGGGGGGKKKVMVIIGIVLILGIGAFVTLQVLGDTEENKPEEGPATSSQVYDPTELDGKKPLMVDLGELTASMTQASAGNPTRRQIRMHPVLLLRPFLKGKAVKIFDEEKNKQMLDRYDSLKPVLRQIILETVYQMDNSSSIGPRELAEKLLKRINGFDEKEQITDYRQFFGKRVQRVILNSYEPR